MSLLALLALLVLLASVVAVAAPAVSGGAVSAVGVLLAAAGGGVPFGLLGVVGTLVVAGAAVHAERHATAVGTPPDLARDRLIVAFAFAFLGTALVGAVGAVLAVAAVAAADAYGTTEDRTRGLDAAVSAVASVAVPLLLTGALLHAVQLAA